MCIRDRLRALESVFSGRKPTAARMPRELTLYTTDLTALAREKKLDPLIGREEEVEEVLSVLARRTKNNPCLLGEPGVGKTAIAEGVAQQFAAGHAGRFSGRRVLSLNLGAMPVSYTHLRIVVKVVIVKHQLF